MHDPEIVLFEIRYPWWRRVDWGTRRYHRRVVTLWHYEPGGRDSGTICKREWPNKGTGWTWFNVKFAARHWRHLRVQIHPYDRIYHWLVDRCAECEYRFRWNQGRMGYMSSEEVWHEQCQQLRHAKAWSDDLEAFIKGEADDNCKFRVEYRLHLNLIAEAEQALYGEEQ